MSSQIEVDDIETKLNVLSQRYKAQGQSAQNLIDADQESILHCLRNGIHSIQTIFESLTDDQDITISSEDQLTISLNYVSIETPRIPGAFIVELDSPEASLVPNPRRAVALRDQCTQMSTCFTALAKSADKQLDDVMEIQLASTDVEAKLDMLKAELDKTTESAQRAVTTTYESLERKKTENEGAQRQLATVEADLRAVENKASENKTHRKVAKVIKFSALVAAPVFPIAAIGVAAAGQIGHMVLKDKKQDLMNEIESATTQNQTLQSEIASFEQQRRDLESSLLSKETLSSRCDELCKQAQQSKKELGCRANEYQTLKEAASHFLLWTEGLQNRAALIEDFDEGDEIKSGVLRLVGDLERCEREEVRRICGPLRALVKRGKGARERELL